MLNLKQAVTQPDHDTGTARASTLYFNSNILLGNIGESLVFRDANHEQSVEKDDVAGEVEVCDQTYRSFE